VDRGTVRAWCLYDFGNSAFAMLFAPFFSTHYGEVVRAGGRDPETLYAWTLVASSLAVMVTAPFLGGIADHAGVRKRMLALYTGVAVAAVLAFPALPAWGILGGFLLGTVANAAFEGGTVFYNAYLPEIAPPERHGRVSAQGFAVGYAGSLLALAAAAIFVGAGAAPWLWVALAVQWGLVTLFVLPRLPPDRATGMGVRAAAARGLKDTWRTLASVVRMRDLAWFLVAYFFFMDGVNTVVSFAALYATVTLRLSPAELVAMLAMTQVTALIGSLAMARPTDRRGPRWAVGVLLGWWTLVVTAACFVEGKAAFFGVAAAAGLGLGAIQSSSRAFMARLIPAGREAELFGFYALCGRAGAIKGPLVFAWVTSAAGGDQRPAVLSVAALFALGGLCLLRVRPPAPAA
jgi:UMF1 family MFS transporter